MVDQQELAISPLTTRPQRQTARRLPYLYDPDTIRRILEYAAELPDGNRCPHRGPTYATMFALLAGLGLRIGEVSRLQCGDVDLQGGVLLVRNSKFGKSRMVRSVPGSQSGYEPASSYVNSASDFRFPMPRSSHGTDARRS